VARVLTLSAGTASQYLRILNARGLLRATRAGRRVTYRLAPDSSVHGTHAILRALRSAFIRAHDPAEKIFRFATAFTHPRRIAIVRQLDGTGMDAIEMGHRTGISREALQRHLTKLEDRGMITRRKTGPAETYRLAAVRDQFGRTLLHLACDRTKD
jgi:DNA-binding transcriptional ArsR family regulator